MYSLFIFSPQTNVTPSHKAILDSLRANLIEKAIAEGFLINLAIESQKY
jgi:hypothetical protein